MKTMHQFTNDRTIRFEQYQKSTFTCIVGSDIITLRISCRSKEIADLLSKYGVSSAIIITAHNPDGIIANPIRNLANEHIMICQLALDDYIFFPAIGGNLQHSEIGNLVLIDDPEDQLRLMSMYNQEAIVRVSSDGIPEIVSSQ